MGTVDAGVLAEVDTAGLTRPTGSPWVLDWWVGAEDRWHLPGVEAAVRQQPMGAAPVTETAMRVPGGDIVHRAFGVVATAGAWRGPAVVVEVENRTAVPVALAVVVRPLTLDGPGRIVSAGVEGSVIRVDGRDAVLLSRPAARVVTGRSARSPMVADLLAGGEDRTPPLAFEDRDGRTEVAAVVPLTHGAVLRVLLPHGGAPSQLGDSWEAPSADAVVGGWRRHREDAARLVLPVPGLSEGVSWADALLALSGPDEIGACLDRDRRVPAGPAAAVRAAEVAEALARLGADAPAAPVARALAAAQRLGGESRLGDRSDGTVALLWAAAAVLARISNPDDAEHLIAPVAVAVRRLRKGRGIDGGLAPSAVRALRAVAPGLLAAGQPEVASDALAAAVSLGGAEAPITLPEDDSTLSRALRARNAISATSTGAAQQVVGPRGVAGSQEGDAQDGLVAPDEAPPGGAITSVLRELWDGHESVGRSDAEEILGDGVVVAAGVLGFDVSELAARTNAALDVMARDGEGGPVLLAACPPAWVGSPMEAHGLLTPWGKVSYAVRWHGDRPALLWEIEPAPGLDPERVPVVTAPGLDPGWRAAGWSGEALLDPVDTAQQTAEGAAPSPVEPRPQDQSTTGPPTDTEGAPSEGGSFS